MADVPFMTAVELFREHSVYELAEQEERHMEIQAGPDATPEEVQAEREAYIKIVTERAIKSRDLWMSLDTEPVVPTTPVGQLLRNRFTTD